MSLAPAHGFFDGVKTQPDLRLIKQVEQVTMLGMEGTGPALCQDSEHGNQVTIVIIIFIIWQLSAWLIFRCRKQPEQRGAANGDLLAKGLSANATEKSACRIEPVWDFRNEEPERCRGRQTRGSSSNARRTLEDALQRHGAV
jgi:hypothetical protein